MIGGIQWPIWKRRFLNINRNISIYSTDLEKEIFEYQSQYLNLLNKLNQLWLSGEQPSEELVKQARELGQAAQIPDFLLRLI
jgi:hypothetical protein